MRFFISFFVLFFSFFINKVSFANDEAKTDLSDAIKTILEQAPEVKANFSVGYWSKYVGSSNLLIHDKGVWTADLSINVGDHFGFEIWECHDFNSEYSDSFADETDFTFSWSDSMEVLGKTLNYKPSINYYILYPSGESKGDMLVFSLDTVIKDPFDWGWDAFMNLDRNQCLSIPGDAWGGEVGVKKDFLDPPWSGWSFSAEMSAVWDGGVYELERGWNSIFAVGLTLPIAEWFKPTIKVEWYRDFQDRVDRDSSNLRFGVDILSIDF